MATAAPMVGEVFGQYRIIRVLGKGGMAIVYEAEDLNLGRRVALKFLPEAVRENHLALERFRREARAASALNHPNICTIYGVEESTDRAFIAMELIEGATLKEVIRANRLGEVGMIVDASIQIADALAAAHAKGIIHRDVKPSNILVTEHGLVKILDFGLAKATLSAGANSLDDSPTLDSSDDHLTSPGSTLGTIAYMSPEQVRGRELDARTDLFSMGVVLYEMCTRTLPFDGETAGVIFEAILNRVPAPVSELNNQIPAQLEAIIFKALEKDRDVRYQSAADIRADLRRIKRDLQTDLSSGAGGASVRQTRSKARPATTISITLAGLLALAFLFFSVNRGKRTSNAADHPSGPKSLTASSLAFGTVLVNTNVDDAAVFVDGQKMAQISGKTTTLNLSGGKHDIRLEKEGFQSAGIMIEVTEHFQTQLQLTLLPVSLQLSPMSVEDTEPIRELIEYKFKNAYESQDVAELRRIWPSVSDQLVDAVKNSRGIDLYLKCNPEASNTEAMARCNEYAILNQKTLKASIVTFHLKKVGPDWQIVSSQ